MFPDLSVLCWVSVRTIFLKRLKNPWTFIVDLRLYSIIHSPPKNIFRACLKVSFVSLSISSIMQVGAYSLLSKRFPQHFGWYKGLKWSHVFLTNVFLISYWTWTYVHSIINFSKDTVGTPWFSFFLKNWCHNHIIFTHK